MLLECSQLIYTSFDDVGFRLLTSQKVSAEIRQFFTDHIIHQYWNSYDPPEPNQRAVYLSQLNRYSTLFGWLFNDGIDDMGRDNVPYFIAYYLKAELSLRHLKTIFNILERGPLSLIQRQKVPGHLRYLSILESCPYQPARLGVKISVGRRDICSTLLDRGELLNLYAKVSLKKQESPPDKITLTFQKSNLQNRSLESHPQRSAQTSVLLKQNIESPPQYSLKPHIKPDLSPTQEANQEILFPNYIHREKEVKVLQTTRDLFSGVLEKIHKLDDSAINIRQLVELIQAFSVQMNEQVLTIEAEESRTRNMAQHSSLRIAEMARSFSHKIRNTVVDIEELIQFVESETHEIAHEIEVEQQRVVAKVQL